MRSRRRCLAAGPFAFGTAPGGSGPTHRCSDAPCVTMSPSRAGAGRNVALAGILILGAALGAYFPFLYIRTGPQVHLIVQ